jgi:hypothetical protein
MQGSAGSPRIMQRADEPAEEDDSNETNIAVAHRTTEALTGRETWSRHNGKTSERGLRVQKSRGMSERIGPHRLIRVIEDSKIPLGEEESRLQKIKGKVEHDEQLSREDEAFLTRLAERAKEWQKGLTSSSNTAPEDTMSG